jgi:hypothetical protein
MEQNVIMGLGWFSIGLGVAELVSPGAVSRLIGVQDDAKTRKVLRGYGVRELAAGFGILTHRRPTKWLWSRVAGDVMDLASLASAMQSDNSKKGRVVAATTAVAGITALDVVCAQRLAAEDSDEARPEAAAKADQATKVTRSIIVDRPAKEAYDFWRNFGNLPRFMTYLESVGRPGTTEVTGRRRGWRASRLNGTRSWCGMSRAV